MRIPPPYYYLTSVLGLSRYRAAALIQNKFVSTRQRRWYFANRGKLQTAKPKASGATGAPHPNLWGQQPTAVLRWMGKEGWNFDQAKAAMRELGVKVSDNTIREALPAGKKGVRGKPAEITGEQRIQLQYAAMSGMSKDAEAKEQARRAKNRTADQQPTKVQGLTYTGDYDPSRPADALGESVRRFLNERGGVVNVQETVEIGRRLSQFVDEAPQMAKKRGDYLKAQEARKAAEAEQQRLIQEFEAWQQQTGEGVATQAWADRLDGFTMHVQAAAHREFSAQSTWLAARRVMTRTVLASVRDMGFEPQAVAATQKMIDEAVGKQFANKHGASPPSPERLREMEFAVQEAAKRMPTDWAWTMGQSSVPGSGDRRPEMHLATADRGYKANDRSHMALSGANGTVHLQSTAAHEMTHMVEDVYPRMVRLQREYWKMRQNGEAPSPIHGDPDEIGIRDQFSNHYTGRVYGGQGNTDPDRSRNFEIATMTIEDILFETPSNTHRTYEQDRQTYDFVLGLMALPF